MTMVPAESPVLILGAGSDIAVALAHEFARVGHPIILAARRPEELAPVRSDLEIRHRVPVATAVFDALDTGGHAAFMAAVRPRPRIVISAVGLMGDQEARLADPAAAELVMRSNYAGPALALEAAARMLAQIDAPTAIVGIGSVAGDRGRAKNYLYGSAKAGFAAYLSGLRQRLDGTPVHVMTVKPGWVRTAMTEGMDLPPVLTSSPERIARLIRRALDRKRLVVTPFPWGAIMAVIRLLPEGLFRKLRF
jgi:hypothetical protein